VVLGDRFEIFAASTAAMLLHIPIAHLHGGETTEGAVDEQVRHAITKMAQLHFVAAEPYRQRVLQMGESEDRVYLVGAPGLDVIERASLPQRAELEATLGWPLHGPFAVATYHPVTLDDDPAAGIHAFFTALRRVPELRVLFTGVNADEGNAAISAAIKAAVAADPARFHAVQSLGQRGYLGAVRMADVVLGNSSSGLVEAPAIGTPTVNIGDRQRGRLRADSVIDVGADADAIEAGIRAALTAERSHASPPYGGPGASRRIADILRTVDLHGLRRKVFVDR
jgi:UDP-hydrolysing UDP-N-acetyl-D-glucosamine 2-epimerase